LGANAGGAGIRGVALRFRLTARDGCPPDRPLTGVEAFPSRDTNEVVLWVEDYGAVIAGDTLVDFGQGLEIPLQWLEGVTRDQVVRGLRPLLDLPVEHVLATHGGPTDRAALERALA
jgi:hypothetical protein